MLSTKHLIEFREKGYTILEDGLTTQQIDQLSEEGDILMNYLMTEGLDIIRDLGCIIEPWTCGYLDVKTNDYKTNKSVYKELRDSLHLEPLGSSTADLILNVYSQYASQLLYTQQVYLLNEQFIMKPPKRLGLSEFTWHRDSDYYTDKSHREIETVACWIALDTVNEENGTIEIKDFQGNLFTLKLKAGGILFMSNQLLHRSQANQTASFRRAFMVQYSIQPIQTNTTSYIGLAIPCLCKQ